MSELGMVVIYVAGALLLAAIGKRVPWLRRQVGWAPLGAQSQPSGHEAIISGYVAALGTSAPAREGAKWRVHRASLGVRFLTPCLTFILAFRMAAPGDGGGMMIIGTPPAMIVVIALGLIYANVYVHRFQVATNGAVLRVSRMIGAPKRYALSELTAVEEDSIHSFRLSFSDGRSIEILKAVAGAAQLRQLLAQTVERNQRG